MSRIVLDKEATTDASHGKSPASRTIEELLEAGYIVLDKPHGPNSHQATAWARDVLGLSRIGHGGTLDPFATGVLLVMTGRAMRLTRKVLSHDKAYVGVLRGKEKIPEEALQAAVDKLQGEIWNVPPKQSAVKIQVRSRKLSAHDLLDVDDRHAALFIECAAGTYIRTLVRDLGLLIGKPLELTELRRTRSGRWTEKQAIPLQTVKDAMWLWQEKGEETALRRIVAPIEDLVADLPVVVVKDSAASAIAHGATLARPGIVELDSDIMIGDTVALLTLKGELVATAEMLHAADDVKAMDSGDVARASAVFLSTDVYPRTWQGQKSD